jgi:glycosyltransferase involved in cell wall biosynthesis
MKLDEITPLILTFNEEANLSRLLDGLKWASSVVIVDSFSKDNTEGIAASYSNTKIFRRVFDNHTAQWNYGLDQIQTDWVLTLDADYRLTDEFLSCLSRLQADSPAYSASFRFCVLGRSLRSTLYPQRVVLFKASNFRYVQDGHTQLLNAGNQEIRAIAATILHDDRKPLSHWFASQAKYALLEADKLRGQRFRELGWKDKLRRLIFPAPILTLIYCLVFKRLILDGWSGVLYSLQRVFAELMLSIVLVDQILRSEVSETSKSVGTNP